MPVTLTKTGPTSGEIAFSTTLGPETTFDYLADFSKHQEWTDELVSLERTSDGPLAAGTTYRGVERLRPAEEMKDPILAQVTAFERPRLIEWETWTAREDGVKSNCSRWAFEIVPHGKGCHVTHRFAFDESSVWNKLSRRAFVAVADRLMGGAGASPKQLTKRVEQLQHVLDVRNAVEQL
jgi:Polyketide cyclase / dehydrase and lipid transport